MTTLVELLHAIRGGRQQDQVLAVLYYYTRYGDQDSATVTAVREGLVKARIPKARSMNVSRALNHAGPYADRDKGWWSLTASGEAHVRDLLGLPWPEATQVHETSGLKQVAVAVDVDDEDVRGYIEEAIKCLAVDALRAAVVFLWTGAARTLQDKALAKGVKLLNAAIVKHDPKARSVTKLDDFAYIKDKTLLLACGELGVLDKGERTTLEESLNLRNRCGHPTRYKPRSAKVSSFIEDVVGIVWTQNAAQT